MQDLVELRNFYQTYKEQEPLVLCTLVRKSGSSYRDVGAKKIVSLNDTGGKSCGFLSGGCLEASIEKMARERIHEMPFIESFSTLSEEDRLMGYQTGCQGVIEVLFEKMQNQNIDLMIPFGSPAKAAGVSVTLAGPQMAYREFSEKILGDENLFFEPWIEPVHLVIVGCGADADAYLPLAKSLGWSIQFLDHRRDLAFPERFPNEKVERVSVEKMAMHIPEGPNTAVVLMTHNYEVDLEIMRGLKNHRVGYLGCLGPAVRYARLKNDLLNMYDETISAHLDAMVSAPAGLYSHSRSPSEIALSVVAQIQGRLVESSNRKVWTLILAAGASRRFGGPKALASLNGQTLLARALQTAKNVSGENILTVTGGYADEFATHLKDSQSVFNDQWEKGMGTSIAAGIAAIRRLDPKAETILILPVDQPLVSPEHLKMLAQQSHESKRCVLTANDQGLLSAPAALPKHLFDRAKDLQGDRGLKSVLKISEMMSLENSDAVRDIDHPNDLQILVQDLTATIVSP